ncbi:MAG: protein kinase [Planctomycetes bacterium]|nr:protein kinase [Planctomycetota bacterium]
MAIVQRIGDPENESEAKAIQELARSLPADYVVAHNFEVATDHGLPYEFDVVVIGEWAVYHCEVKGYRGPISGDRLQWRFENGGVYPSPIPLANKKSKILSTRLAARTRGLDKVWVETVILLTDEQARVKIRDEQASRVLHLGEAAAYLTDPSRLPVRTESILPLHNEICEVVFGTRPAKKVKEIGLYTVLEKIGQFRNRVSYLAEHRYIRMRPKTVLKVFHYNVYASKGSKDTQIRMIFHDQEALRLLSSHPNILQTGDFFAWEGDKFVLPTEYIEQGRPLESLLDKEEDRKISWSEKRRIVQGIAEGLRHCHRGGVIHRDVRPLNVVVAPSGDVKLVNFDLARIKGAPAELQVAEIEERLDPRYTAPEVWHAASAANEASDVYSLGILFYELITSRRPYAHVDEAIARKAVPLDRELLLRELSTPGSEDFMRHPADAAEAIARMCSFDAAARYSSMGDVIEDLDLIGD